MNAQVRVIEKQRHSATITSGIQKTSLITESLANLDGDPRKQQTLDHHLNEIHSMGRMTGSSHRIKEVFALIDKLSKSSCNVLLMGESGTGKEMVAVAIHEKSDRRNNKFVAVNCSAIPGQLLESELFGHKRGAFTGASESRRGLFEEANGGTIFLDEIGDMPIELQAKILRVIQEREVTPVGENCSRTVDVRIISATHNDLSIMVQQDRFRQDLYYRLAVVPVWLPRLADRREDIPLLANHFLLKYCRNSGTKKTLTPAAIAKLMDHPWPGNVRELENNIERAVVLSDGELIDEKHILDAQTMEKHSPACGVFSKLMPLAEVERCYILFVLGHTEGKKDLAAKILGIDRKTLYRREVEYGLADGIALTVRPNHK